VKLAAPYCLAVAVGVLIGVTLWRPINPQADAFATVRVIDWRFWPDRQ
jgi:hypothetical protein